MPTPAVGRVVHFVRDASEQHYAATITRVDDAEASPPLVSLYVAFPIDQSIDWRSNVPEDPTGQAPDSWHWPEMV